MQDLKEELKGKCKFCLGCNRLEDKSFNGTDNCTYMPNGLLLCKEIIEGIQKNL